MKHFIPLISILCLMCNNNSTISGNNKPDGDGETNMPGDSISNEYIRGVDLSYVNQILDFGGVYRNEDGNKVNPYAFFSDKGANYVRLRLWHTPDWTRELSGTQQYNDIEDVKLAAQRVKEQEMNLLLDFHYSDFWADPERQLIPDAWQNIKDLETLKDSVFKYTLNTMEELAAEDLMPKMVQIGNETNCGMMYTEAPEAFPALNVCNGHWQNMGEVLNSAIRAIRKASQAEGAEIKIALHIAQPENVEWWVQNIMSQGKVNDFEIVGFSYYAPWSEVPITDIKDYIKRFRQQFDKEIIILETAYSWTLNNTDNYNNIFNAESDEPGYPQTPQGQQEYMIDLTRFVLEGEGTGVFYWEPAWITSDLRDPWGQGSSWENNTFFDFQGKPLPVFKYLTFDFAE